MLSNCVGNAFARPNNRASILNNARAQFAFTVAFHIVFPAFSIGLASYVAVLNALHLRTGRAVYLALFDYWKTIFAVAFGMSVVSGIVMSYQFGTNWSVSRPGRADRRAAHGLRGALGLLPRGGVSEQGRACV